MPPLYQNINIAEKIGCKNPQMLFEEEFDCITKTTSFANVCLDKNVLKAAMGAWREFRDETRSPENKNYRFISYKQYIWWSYGYLGKNKRKPLPNCVITKIRNSREITYCIKSEQILFYMDGPAS